MAAPATLESDFMFIHESLAGLFPDDELEPGLTTSQLVSGKGKFYAAIVRWPRRDIKHVIISVQETSAKRALAEVRARLVRYVAAGLHEQPYVPSTPAPAPEARL